MNKWMLWSFSARKFSDATWGVSLVEKRWNRIAKCLEHERWGV